MSRLRESIERIKHILEDSGYSVALNESGRYLCKSCYIPCTSYRNCGQGN